MVAIFRTELERTWIESHERSTLVICFRGGVPFRVRSQGRGGWLSVNSVFKNFIISTYLSPYEKMLDFRHGLDAEEDPVLGTRMEKWEVLETFPGSDPSF